MAGMSCGKKGNIGLAKKVMGLCNGINGLKLS
jgi:hypothetical protein